MLSGTREVQEGYNEERQTLSADSVVRARREV
jgi:hypothetical protein